MKTRIQSLESHCQSEMQKRFWAKLNKLQKFKISRDGMYLRALLESFFVQEKYALIQLFFEKLIEVPFLEDFTAWQDTEQMLCLCYALPNASPEQKQAIERRFWQIANFKSSFAGTQHLYDNYLSDILSLTRLKGLQRQIPNYYGDDLVAYRSAIITEAIRVKIANTLTDKNPDIEQKMNQIITNELKALQA